MLEWISLLYELYNDYLFLGIFLVCALIGYHKKKQVFIQSVTEKSVMFFAVFAMGMACSLSIKWLLRGLFAEIIRVSVGACVSIFLGWNSCKTVNWLIGITKKVCSKESVKQWGYGFAIFVLWMGQLITQLPEEIAKWGECWYAMDYSMGIGSRFFIGSVLSLFYDEYMDRSVAYVFCLRMTVLLVALCSFMLGKVLYKTKYKVAVVFLIASFWACPASLASYWNAKNFGRLEVYTLLTSLACICLFLKLKKTWLKYGLLCVGTVISNAIYQGYVFMYFPIIFIVIVCELYKNKCQKSDLIGGVAVLMSACVSFLFFQFGTSVVFETVEEFETAIAARSNVYVAGGAISAEFFSNISRVFLHTIDPFLKGEDLPREILAFTVVVFAPMIVTGIALYTKCFQAFNLKSNKKVLNPYLWCILCQFAILPQFLLNIDWGRWFITIVIVFFFGVFYMLYIEMEEMIYAIETLDCFVKKHYYVAVLVVLYFTLFGKFTEYGMINQTFMIFDNAFKILRTIL